MSPEAQRIAIAEACGFGGEFSKRWILEVGMEGEDKFAFAATRNNLDEEVPDFLNDLNAMHEAEETLSRNQRAEYWHEIIKLCNEEARGLNDFDRVGIFYQLHAKAAQRAEAFLRTINKWEDGA